jgi:GNAT superfamily N-acetyltransferase
MEAVSKAQLRNLLPLYRHDFPNRTACLSFIEGQMPGEAFVDRLSNPTACIVVIDFHNWTFVGGQPNQDWLNSAFVQLCRDRYLEVVWATWSTISVEPPPKADSIYERFEFEDLYTCYNQSGSTVQFPQGCHFLKMDVNLLKRCLWRDKVISMYGNIDNFISHGLGYCLMNGDEICSEAYASFRAEGQYEIGVITAEPHRGRGYAYITCDHLVDECAKSGYQTTWSCDRPNAASIATARKLGYQRQREYQVLYYLQNP